MPDRVRIQILILTSAFLALFGMGVWQESYVPAFLWLGFGILLLDLFWPRFDLAGQTWVRGNRRLPNVALTFDDGPDPVATPRLLDVLKRLDVRVTFFVLGRHAEQYPEIVRRIATEGHEIGSHGFSHIKYTKLSPSRIEADLRAWEKAVLPLTDAGRPAWLRTPHGWKHLFVRRMARKLGYRLVAWTKGVWDTDQPGTDAIVRRSLRGVRNGEVILLHDGDGSGRGADRAQTVDAVAPLVEALRGRGFSMVTLTELFRDAKAPVPWGKLLVGVGMTLAMVAYVVTHFDLREIARHLTVSAPLFLLASIGLDFACLFAKSQSWREFVLPLAPIGRFRAFAFSAIGAMLNNVLPLRGGDLGRMELLGRKKDVKRLHGYSTIVLEAVMNGLALVPILLAALFVLPLKEPLGQMLRYFSLLMAGVVVVMVFLSRGSGHRWLRGLEGFRQWRTLGVSFLFQLAGWVFYLLSLTCMLRACGVIVPPWAAPVIALALAGSMFIPAAPGRLGAFEAAIVLSLSLFEVPVEKAIGFALVLHATQTLPTLVWGGLAWFWGEAQPVSREEPAVEARRRAG